MCDDREPDDLSDEDDQDEMPEVEDEDLDAFVQELFGPDPLIFGADEGKEGDQPPTPGERVLYALGQLHRLHLARRLPVHPGAFAIEDVVSILGLADQLEFASQDRHGHSFHFPSEVLHIDPDKPFPWRLLGVWEWAAEQEAHAYWAEGWD